MIEIHSLVLMILKKNVLLRLLFLYLHGLLYQRFPWSFGHYTQSLICIMAHCSIEWNQAWKVSVIRPLSCALPCPALYKLLPSGQCISNHLPFQVPLSHFSNAQLGAPLQAYNQVPLDTSSRPLPSPWTPRPRLRATWRHAKSSTDTFLGNFKVSDILRRILGYADFLKMLDIYLAALCLSCGMWHLRASCGIHNL